MTFNTNLFFRIKPGSWQNEIPIAGFQTFFAAYTNTFVYDPGICPRLLINPQCINGTGRKTRWVETLKTNPWLIIPSHVVFVQYEPREGGRVPPLTIEIRTNHLTGPTTRAD
jgi:hypothetical protein